MQAVEGVFHTHKKFTLTSDRVKDGPYAFLIDLRITINSRCGAFPTLFACFWKMDHGIKENVEIK
jgi:hypothetical protein